MALNPMARTFVPKGHGETTATSSDNNSSSRIIRGGEGHQQQPTDSTNVVICIESNNNATLQESSPPLYKSTQPSADSSGSTICQQNDGNNNNLPGNNNWQLQANNNNNNENTEQNRTQPNDVQFNPEELPVSTDRDPLQQINNASNIGSLPSLSSSAAAAINKRLRGIVSSVQCSIKDGFNKLSQRRALELSSTAAVDSDSTSSNARQLTVFCAGSNDNNNNNNATYQSPTKRSKRQEAPPAPPAAPNRSAVQIRRRRIPTNASLQGTGFDDKRINRGIKRTRQANDGNVDNGAKRTKRTERVEVDTTALVCILSFGMLLCGT